MAKNKEPFGDHIFMGRISGRYKEGCKIIPAGRALGRFCTVQFEDGTTDVVQRQLVRPRETPKEENGNE